MFLAVRLDRNTFNNSAAKNRTGYLETTQMGRTNKARLAVCSKAIVKRESLAFVFFSRLDGYSQTSLLRGGGGGESNSDCLLFPVCSSDLVTSRPRSAIQNTFDMGLFV